MKESTEKEEGRVNKLGVPLTIGRLGAGGTRTDRNTGANTSSATVSSRETVIETLKESQLLVERGLQLPHGLMCHAIQFKHAIW